MPPAAPLLLVLSLLVVLPVFVAPDAAPAPAPTSAPAPAPGPAPGQRPLSGVCAAYTSSGQPGDSSSCIVTLDSGDTISFGTTSVAGSACDGDTWIGITTLSASSCADYGTRSSCLANNDDSGSGSCSYATFTAASAGAYALIGACYRGETCGGTLAWTIVPIVTTPIHGSCSMVAAALGGSSSIFGGGFSGPVACSVDPGTTYAVGDYNDWGASLACFNAATGQHCSPGDAYCPCIYPSAPFPNGAFAIDGYSGGGSGMCVACPDVRPPPNPPPSPPSPPLPPSPPRPPPRPGARSADQPFTCCNGESICRGAVNNPDDCEALGDLYYSLGGPHWSRNNGWAQAAAGIPTDICKCRVDDGQVPIWSNAAGYNEDSNAPNGGSGVTLFCTSFLGGCRRGGYDGNNPTYVNNPSDRIYRCVHASCCASRPLTRPMSLRQLYYWVQQCVRNAAFFS